MLAAEIWGETLRVSSYARRKHRRASETSPAALAACPASIRREASALPSAVLPLMSSTRSRVTPPPIPG